MMLVHRTPDGDSDLMSHINYNEKINVRQLRDAEENAGCYMTVVAIMK